MKSKSAYRLVRTGSRLFAIAIVTLLAAQSGRATPTNTYYWDTNGNLAGAGTTAGNWATSGFWSLDPLGLSSTNNYTTLSTDDVYFSAGTTGTGGGNPQVTLSAAQDIGNIFLNYRPDLIELGGFKISGSTINLYSGIDVQTIGASIGGYNYENNIASAIALQGAATLENNSPLTFLVTGGITGSSDLTLQNNSNNNLGLEIQGTTTLSGSAKIINSGTGTGMAYFGQPGSSGGVIAGTFDRIVQDSLSSVLYLGATNTFTATIELKQGLLIEGSSNSNTSIVALGNTANQILFNGGILGYMTRTNGSIDLSNRFSSASTGDYKIDIPVSGSTFATSLSRTGVGLHKYGQGSLTLSAAAAYDGKTTIGGIDVVNRQVFGGGTLNINVSLNGTLGTDLEFKGTGVFNVAEATGVDQGMKALSFTDGDGTVKSTYAGTPGTDTSVLSFSSYARAAGATANFVIAGSGVNGTDNKITLGGMALDALIDGAFFNGSAYAWYDTLGYVRGINYGVDFLTYGTLGPVASLSSAINGDHQQANWAVSAQQTDTFASLNLKNTSGAVVPTIGNQAFTLAAGQTVTTDQVLVSGGAGNGAIVTISGGTAIRPNFNTDFVVRTDVANDRLVISNFARNGTNALAKSGTGTLVLAGANTIGGNGITGNISINDGALLINTSADTTYTGHVSGQGRLDVMGSGGKVILAPTAPLTQTGGMVVNGTVVLDFSNMTDPTNMLFTGIPGNKGTSTGSGLLQLGGGTGNIARTVQQNATMIIKGKPGAFSTYQQLGATGIVGSGAAVTTGNGMGSILIDPNGGTDTTVLLAQLGNGGGSYLMLGKAAGAGSGNVYFQSGYGSASTGNGGDWGRFYYTSDGGTTVDFLAGSTLSQGPSNIFAMGTNGTSYTPMTASASGSYTVLTGASSSFDTSVNPAGTLTRTSGLGSGVKIQDVNNGQILDMNGGSFGDGVSGWLMTGDSSHTGTFSVLNGHAGVSNSKGNKFGLGQFALSQDLVWGVDMVENSNTTFIKNGGGRVIIQNTVASTYAGGTFINDGIIQVNAADGLKPFGSGLIRFSGGTLQYSANNQADYSLRFSAAGNEPIKIDTNGQNVTFANSIKGAVTTLTKLGEGTLSLTAVAAATYTGLTTVSGGTLSVGSTTDINTSSGVNIGAGNFNYNSANALSNPVVFTSTGGTLSGSGTITPAVSVTSGNNLAPGSSAGTLSFSNGLAIAAGGIFNWENSTLNTLGSAGTDWDVANITGGTTTISSAPGSGSKLKLQFTDALTSFSNSFWDASQTWSFVSGGVSAGNLFDTSNISVYVNAAPIGAGNTISGQGAFTTAVSGSNLELVWTPSIGGAGNNSQILITSAPDSSSIVTGASAKTLAFSRVLVGSTHTTGTLALGNSGSDTAAYTVTTSSDVAATTFASGSLAGSGSASGSITLNTATTGSKSGTLTIANTSPDSLGAGLGSADANDVFTVTGTVVAARTVTAPATTALGTFHAGATVNVTSNSFAYGYGAGGTGANSDTEDSTVQAYAGAADGNGITLTGGSNSVSSAAGFTRSFTGTAVVNTSGGSFTSTVNPEISAATTVNAAYTIGVYSGLMGWIGSTGSAWATGSNWSDSVSGGAQVAPGLDPGYAGVDSASFGSTSGGVTVNLDSAAPSVNQLTFNGTGNYILAQGSGPNGITLAGTTAKISSAGTQGISAPVSLANPVEVAVSGGTLTVSGGINENSSGMTLLKSGGGILDLSGSSNYSGLTTVDNGTLLVNTSIAGAVTVTSGVGTATLGGSGSITGPLNVTGILSPGGSSLESLASGNLSLASGSTFAYQVDSSVAHSVGADLQKVAGTLDLLGTVNLTLSDIAALPVAFAANTTFSLFNYTGLLTGQLTYNSTSLTDGAAFTDAGWLNTWVIDYNAPTGGANFSGEYAGGADSFVNITAASYNTWAAGWTGPALSNLAVDADPDNDGLDNALEYVLGTDPRVANQGGATGGVVGTNLVLSFTRKDSSETSDVALRVEVSTNLTDWTTLAGYTVGNDTASSTTGVVVNEAGASDDIITVTIPKGADVKKFARLKVTVTP